MEEKKEFDRVARPSVVPYFVLGVFCLLYALFFPLYLWWHYLIPAVLGTLLFILCKAVCKPRYVTVEIPQREKTEEEKWQDEARETIKKLEKADIAIEDEEVSKKIVAIENLTENVFRIVMEKPSKKSQVRRFINYYLPTIFKMLSSYERAENETANGENIRTMKQKISGALDMAIGAFSKLCDDLYSDESIDISTDITVFRELLRQENLLNESEDK